MGRNKTLQRVCLGVASATMLLLQTNITQAGSRPYSAPRFRRSYSAQTPYQKNYSARFPWSRRYSPAMNKSYRRDSSFTRGTDYSSSRFSYSYPYRYGYGLLGYGSLSYFPRYHGYFPYHFYYRPWYSGYGNFYPDYFYYGYPWGW
jgi:hypothetical protein